MPQKTNYKQKVLEYLKKHPGESISRDLLIQKTGVSKSRLSEILASIREDGYTILTPPRSGFIRFEAEDREIITSTIKDSDVRQWIILYILSLFEQLSYPELAEKMLEMKDPIYTEKNLLHNKSGKIEYHDSDIIHNLKRNITEKIGIEDIDIAKELLSVTTLRKDLNELRGLNLVKMTELETMNFTQYRYQLTHSAPHLISLTEDQLFEFCETLDDTTSVTRESKLTQRLYRNIKNLISFEERNIKQHSFGKLNAISEQEIEAFRRFNSHPYKSNLLKIIFSSTDSSDPVEFAGVLIYYSVETDAFYCLGKNMSNRNIWTIRLDKINHIETLDQSNLEYSSEQTYRKILNEMFSTGYSEEVYPVKVLLSGQIRTIKERFDELCELRKGASIRELHEIPDGTDYRYVYEDTLRGLEDFARYLRSFGRGVIAVSPPELVERMKGTYIRTIENYECIGEYNE